MGSLRQQEVWRSLVDCTIKTGVYLGRGLIYFSLDQVPQFHTQVQKRPAQNTHLQTVKIYSGDKKISHALP